MTVIEFKKAYWNYYKILEERFINTLAYVELVSDNYATYSNEYANILQSIGAELDNIFKQYCGYNNDDIKNITHYANYILSDWPDVVNQSVLVKEYDIKITPFSGWNLSKPKQSLFWWIAFDDIKHSTYLNYKKACLKNVLYSLAALYLIERKHHKDIADQKPEKEIDIIINDSRIFELDNWQTRNLSFGNIIAVTR